MGWGDHLCLALTRPGHQKSNENQKSNEKARKTYLLLGPRVLENLEVETIRQRRQLRNASERYKPPKRNMNNISSLIRVSHRFEAEGFPS
jgi:hypothetical protein